MSISRRTFLGAGTVLTLGAQFPGSWTRHAAAQGSPGPIRLGFQVHRTGIGAVYGRWYERTTNAAVKLINGKGGIGGRPIEIVAEDDGTDPKRGAEVVEKLATQHKVDLIFGTLFSHVVIASAPRAGQLKIPYLVVSEGYHVASGKLNRYVFQPGITDVRAQVTAVAPWILKNLGKKVTMIFPDYAFGHDHRDFFSRVATSQGGTISALIPIPPTETSFTKYFPRVPADTEVLYHVMVGPGVLTFVKEMGEHYGSKRPKIFGFVDSLEGVDLASPGLAFLEGTYFWEAFPRYAAANTPAHVKTFRERVGVNDNGASVNDPKDVSTFSHMFGCWETLHVIKAVVEKSGYRKAGEYRGFIETLEGFQSFPEGLEHPQGAKKFNGKLHQVYGHQFISKVEKRRLDVVHRTAIEDSMYPPEGDYTKQPL
ncbi:MAG: ABC transporter substrate-binding protein [Candidatus Rokubacteria bacterium]|nr:ABC transporter substrate-binding protein [Candidatus Rokubacteria bacterium]